MKNHFASLIVVLCPIFAVHSVAQGTAFTYQGVFSQNGAPYTGSAEMQFTLWDSGSGGTAVATNSPTSVVVGVTNGIFAAGLDFGAGAFPGAERWLQIDVRTAIGPFTTLTPRQKVTATPYAILAGNLSGALPGANLGGTYSNAVVLNNAANSFTGGGAGLTGLNASQLTAGTVPAAALTNAWKINGNSGTTPGPHFIGTLDNQPLVIVVNGQRALRLEPNPTAPNVIGGHSGNIVSNGAEAATIAGGGAGLFAINRVGANGGTVSGGIGNFADGTNSTVAGGFFNRARSLASVAGGGDSNDASANHSTISGGYHNTARGVYATVPGGRDNSATNSAFAAGYRAQANHTGSFVWGDSTDADFASTTTNQFRIRAGGGMEVVGGTNQPAVHYSGARTGGFDTPVGFAENTNTGGQSAPALRVVNNGGDSIYGALSVSAAGTGYIATFGNSSTFVSGLSTNGTWTALAFTPTSDRAAKENFTPVNAREVLDRVAALPLSTWNYKAAPGLAHIGPVAQDFHAAFGLNGDDDKHIATVDADGVALAAIQGLNEKVVEQRTELEKKQTEITELKQRLERLERLMNQKNGGAE